MSQVQAYVPMCIVIGAALATVPGYKEVAGRVIGQHTTIYNSRGGRGTRDLGVETKQITTLVKVKVRFKPVAMFLIDEAINVEHSGGGAVWQYPA